MVLFDSSYLKLEFKNVPCRHLVASWNGSPGDEVYKHGCSTILRCCHENDIRKLVTDTRLQEPVSEAAEEFSEKAISNYVARHGRFYHAVVLSNEVFVKFRVANLDRNADSKKYLHQFFSTQQDAIAWLQQADS